AVCPRGAASSLSRGGRRFARRRARRRRRRAGAAATAAAGDQRRGGGSDEERQGHSGHAATVLPCPDAITSLRSRGQAERCHLGTQRLLVLLLVPSRPPRAPAPEEDERRGHEDDLAADAHPEPVLP